MLTAHYRIASRDIVSETFDGDVVVLDLSCGKYFSFTDSGSMLWQAFSAGVRPETLVSEAAGLAAPVLQAFLRKLLDNGLLAVGPATDATADGWAARLAQAAEAPDVVVFDDLADLFLADPIHDVEEERGWPMVRAN